MEIITTASTAAEWIGQELPQPVFERAHKMLKTLFEIQGVEKVVKVSECLAGV